MKALIHILMLFLTAPALAHSAPECDGFLEGFNRWEIKLKGKLEPRVSFFPVTDWTRNSQFEGVALNSSYSKTIKKPVFEIEYKPGNRREKGQVVSYGRIEPFEGNRLYFSDFKAAEFFKFNQPGFFEIRLKDGNTVICRSTRSYSYE